MITSNCYQVFFDDNPDVVDIVRTLESPDYFAACKDRPGGGVQLDCLFDGLQRGRLIECS